MQWYFGSSQATVIGEGVQKYLNLFETPSSDFMRLCKHTCHYLFLEQYYAKISHKDK